MLRFSEEPKRTKYSSPTECEFENPSLSFCDNSLIFLSPFLKYFPCFLNIFTCFLQCVHFNKVQTDKYGKKVCSLFPAVNGDPDVAVNESCLLNSLHTALKIHPNCPVKINYWCYCILGFESILHHVWGKREVLNLSYFVAHTFILLLSLFTSKSVIILALSPCSIKNPDFSSVYFLQSPKASLKLMDKERNTTRLFLLTVFKSQVKASGTC